LLGFFLALSDCGGSKVRVKSFEFEKALNCIGMGLTFMSGMGLLVDILLNVDGSRMLRCYALGFIFVVCVYLFFNLFVYVYHWPALLLLLDYFGHCCYLNT
jgi:hypothetical protein